jgi:acetyl esterase/lipase
MLLYNPIVDMTEGDWIRYAVGGEALAIKRSPRPAAPEDVALARSLSPVFHVRAEQVPSIVLHGRADRVVPMSQAERFAAASRAVGSRCDLVVYENDIGHAFVLAGYKYPEPVVVEAIRAGDRFLVSLGWLKGEPSLTISDPPAWPDRKP